MVSTVSFQSGAQRSRVRGCVSGFGAPGIEDIKEHALRWKGPMGIRGYCAFDSKSVDL